MGNPVGMGVGMVGSGMGGMPGFNGMGGLPGLGAMGGLGPMGTISGMGGMVGSIAGFVGGLGGGEALFRLALQSSVVCQMSTQMLLVVPAELLQKALVPHGHLVDIAQRCQVRIDLGVEVMPSLQQVSITGSIASNTVAAYFLQERAAQYGTVAGAGAAQAGASNAPVPAAACNST